MKGAQYTVMSSRWEGFSMTLIESLACGTPVLTTRVGGAAEIIRDGINGKLIEPEDIDSLAKNIDYMLKAAPAMRGVACSASVKHLDVGSYARRIEAALHGQKGYLEKVFRAGVSR